jgi:hypothetical protein
MQELVSETVSAVEISQVDDIKPHIFSQFKAEHFSVMEKYLDVAGSGK